jgi:hypothetical protein
LRYRLLLLLAVSLLVSGLTSAALTQSSQTGAPVIPAMPDDVKPIRVAGLGIRVSDLERSKRFYREVLGLKVGARVPAQGECNFLVARSFVFYVFVAVDCTRLAILAAVFRPNFRPTGFGAHRLSRDLFARPCHLLSG